MALATGTQFGAYEILSSIGEGGMGVVYRSRDTRLKRDVAIKVLPDDVFHDHERLTRFQREGEILAALNHPNIATVYGWEQAGPVTGIVLELVEGPTLADRLARERLSVAEAIGIAKQTADALEAAHEHGIVHRDLKPANIKVRDDGTVKVLDFGLAKAIEPAGVAASRGSMSPTITTPAMTGLGAILGTAAYMAPEQAAGKAVDRRADIWSFGVVLWEMLAGRRLFDGETVSHTLADVLRAPIDFDALPPATPRAIRELVKRCLDRDVRARLRDIGEARVVLQNCLLNPSPDSIAAASPLAARSTSRIGWIGWAVAAVLAVAFGGFAGLRSRERVERPPLHLSVPLPGNAAPAFFALSPDGRSVVMSGQGGLVVRSLDSGEVRPLTGTGGARTPFWSPDSRVVAFFADRKLKTVAASGGPPLTLCDEVGTGAGGTWNRAGSIVFAAETGVLTRVAAAGGACTAMIRSGPDRGRRIPLFLPDGDHFLYVNDATEEASRGLYVASLGEPNGRRLLADASSALFVPSGPGSPRGYLVFLREQKLMAQAFDTTALQLSGEPVMVATQVSFAFTPLQIAASADANGTLMYLTNGRPDRQLIWYSRSGAELERAARIGPVLGASVSLAPDGKRVAFRRSDAQGLFSLWVQDLERNQETRLTTPPINPGAAVWSPDGQRVVFGVPAPATGGLYVKNMNGGKEELILPGSESLAPSDWSRDGRWLVYTENNSKTGADIWLLADPLKPSGDRKPVPLVRGPSMESQGQISPDGKWLAYSSNESGISEVYLRALSGSAFASAAVWQVSSSGGAEARWRSDGRELFFLQNVAGTTRNRIFSVPVGTAPNPAGTPRPLFEFQAIGTIQQINVFLYSPSPDGQRFLVNGFVSDAPPSLDIVLNWGSTAGQK
jgi:Tol biopolymer transport system component